VEKRKKKKVDGDSENTINDSNPSNSDEGESQTAYNSNGAQPLRKIPESQIVKIRDEQLKTKQQEEEKYAKFRSEPDNENKFSCPLWILDQAKKKEESNGLLTIMNKRSRTNNELLTIVNEGLRIKNENDGKKFQEKNDDLQKQLTLVEKKYNDLQKRFTFAEKTNNDLQEKLTLAEKKNL